MQAAVLHRVDESFQPMPSPGSGDWLAQHPETCQTFEAFEQRTSKAIPHGT